MKLVRAAIVLLCVSRALEGSITNTLPKPQNSISKVVEAQREKYRLPRNLIPSLYVVDVVLSSIERGTFEARVRITLECENVTTRVVLHSENLIVETSRLVLGDEAEGEDLLTDSGCKQDRESRVFNLLECETKEPLEVGKRYILDISYTGGLGNDNHGLYRSSYKENGELVSLLSTDFGFKARRFLPSFDEPSFKATFQFNVWRDPDLFASTLSNAKPDPAKLVVDQFKPTSVIPPHLIGLVVSNFAKNEGGDEKFAVYSRPGATNQTHFAQFFGPRVIEELGTWTGLGFSSILEAEKMDMVALPELFPDVTESWGITLYREANLLFDNRHTSTAQKQHIAQTIGRGVSHTWFGGLVTCEWWDDFWLNGGLSLYFGTMGVDLVTPTFEALLQFPTTVMQESMHLDGTDAAFPLSNSGKVATHSEIRQMLGRLSFGKGAALMRMIRLVMGDEKFQEAMQHYIWLNKFKSVNHKVLIDILEEYDPNEFVREMMTSFATQAGVPLVHARREENTIFITQSRFNSDETASEQWTIPITVATSGESFENPRAHYHVLRPSDKPLEIDLEDSPDYFILNIQQFGYYRVTYDPASWQRIHVALKSSDFGGIHPANRAQIIDDLFALAWAGLESYDMALDIISYVHDDPHYLPWVAALRGFSRLEMRMADRTEFRYYLGYLMDKVFELSRFKENLEDHLEQLRQIEVLKAYCKANSINRSKCSRQAQDLFDKVRVGYLTNPDFTPAVYCYAAAFNTENWDFLWLMYRASNFASEKMTILEALGCSNEEKIIEKLLTEILSDEIRLQDKQAALEFTYQNNPENVDVVLNFILNNYERWRATMDFVSNLEDLSQFFTKTAQFTKVSIFLMRARIPESDKERLEASLQKNQENLKWDEKNVPVIFKFVKDEVDRINRSPEQPPGGKNGGLKWWAWLLISLGIVAGVALLGLGGWFGYKKYSKSTLPDIEK